MEIYTLQNNDSESVYVSESESEFNKNSEKSKIDNKTSKIYDYDNYNKLLEKSTDDLKNYWKGLYVKLNPVYSNNKVTIPINKHSEIIYRINSVDNEKNIIIGNNFSNIDSFVNLIKKLILKEIITNEYKVKEGYRIIILGTIMKKNSYIIEIMFFIFKLMNANNTDKDLRVILIRGNNGKSDNSYLSNSNFSYEIKRWLPNKIEKNGFLWGKYKDNNKNLQSRTIIENMSKFYKYCPSAIILIKNYKKYWLCHGGFPLLTYKNRNQQTCDIKINPLFPLSNIDVIANNLSNSISQIRWNDFHSENNSKYILYPNSPMFQLTDKLQDNNKNSITKGTNNYFVYRIGYKHIKDFLRETGINFIIKGLNDNTIDFNSNRNISEIIKKSWTEIQDDVFLLKNTNSNSSEKYNTNTSTTGKINIRSIIEGKNNSITYECPVLMISNNSNISTSYIMI